MLHTYIHIYRNYRFSKFLCKCAPEVISEALTRIKKTINCKRIKGTQNEHLKKYSLFDDLQDSSKQRSVALIVYDLAI